MKNVKGLYFDWLIGHVMKTGHPGVKAEKYTRVLSKLFDTPFRYSVDLDWNRESDGLDLRYRFGDEEGIDHRIISCELDCDDCSVLEVMIALAIRCEEQFMTDQTNDNTGYWFWDMIKSLGLITSDNRHYNELYLDYVLEKFLDREYEPDGKGGLFHVPDVDLDFRKEQLWMQLCRYLYYISNE